MKIDNTSHIDVLETNRCASSCSGVLTLWDKTLCMAAFFLYIFRQVYLCWSCCLYQWHIWYIEYIMGDCDISNIFTHSSNIPIYTWYFSVIHNVFNIYIYIYSEYVIDDRMAFKILNLQGFCVLLHGPGRVAQNGPLYTCIYSGGHMRNIASDNIFLSIHNLFIVVLQFADHFWTRFLIWFTMGPPLEWHIRYARCMPLQWRKYTIYALAYMGSIWL